MSVNENFVRLFITSWSRMDAEELSKFFLEDGVYHNMPMQPAKGRDAIRALIKSFAKAWVSTDWEIVSLISHGEMVVAERIDHTVMGDKRVDLPCCGVFQIKQGRIAIWRDYFDMATYAKALA